MSPSFYEVVERSQGWRGPIRRITHAIASLCLLTTCLMSTGCNSSRATTRTVDVAAGRYADAFDAAREALRDYSFTLDRVDARGGVITSEPRFSLGLANPADPVQSSARQEVQDLMNQQGRRVRIVFARPGAEPALEWADEGERSETMEHAPPSESIPSDGVLMDGSALPELGDDLRVDGRELVMHVDVVIDRVHRPGRRLETSSIRQSTTYQDPDLISRGMQPTYAVARERDDALAARLAESIRARLDGAK